MYVSSLYLTRYSKCRMIETTADFGLAAVTAIMCGVGVMMFLLPPVPGVPVYLTLGIVLPAQGHKTLGKNHVLSFLLCLIHECVVLIIFDGIYRRLGWVNCIFLWNWTCVKVIFKCNTAEADRTETLILCQSEAIRWCKFGTHEGHAAGTQKERYFCAKSGDIDRWTRQVFPFTE